MWDAREYIKASLNQQDIQKAIMSQRSTNLLILQWILMLIGGESL